jgi:hypothetical protein
MTDVERDKCSEALRDIERAQGLILRAAQKLSVINGMAPQWSATCKLHDKVKAHWYRVEGRRQKLCPPPVAPSSVVAAAITPGTGGNH